MRSFTPSSRLPSVGEAPETNGAPFKLQDERGAAMASKYVWWQGRGRRWKPRAYWRRRS